jgi:hypothetical protein
VRRPLLGYYNDDLVVHYLYNKSLIDARFHSATLPRITSDPCETINVLEPEEKRDDRKGIIDKSIFRQAPAMNHAAYGLGGAKAYLMCALSKFRWDRQGLLK